MENNNNHNKQGWFKTFINWFGDLPWYYYLIIAISFFFIFYTIFFYIFKYI